MLESGIVPRIPDKILLLLVSHVLLCCVGVAKIFLDGFIRPGAARVTCAVNHKPALDLGLQFVTGG